MLVPGPVLVWHVHVLWRLWRAGVRLLDGAVWSELHGPERRVRVRLVRLQSRLYGPQLRVRQLDPVPGLARVLGPRLVLVRSVHV